MGLKDLERPEPILRLWPASRPMLPLGLVVKSETGNPDDEEDELCGLPNIAGIFE